MSKKSPDEGGAPEHRPGMGTEGCSGSRTGMPSQDLKTGFGFSIQSEAKDKVFQVGPWK